MSAGVIVFLFLVCISFCDSDRVQNLGGKWLLKGGSGKYIDLEATVPGGIYTDLMNNNVIEDIFYGNNDDTTRWVPRSNWTYYTTFTVDNDLLNSENINIVFDGLDTFANIVINDVKVGSSENMFVQYIFNIKDQLKSGDNKIEIQFLSPIEVAANLAAEQNKTYNIPVNCPPNEYRGECHVNMIRKMQASFSWDWGPSFPSVGIWKDLYIEAYNESTIRYVVTDVIEKETSWDLNVDTYFSNNAKQKVVGRVSYQLKLNTLSITRLEEVSESPDEFNEILLSTTISIPKSYVNTWWPNGYGGHDLYDLAVTFTNGNRTETSTKTVRVGFRTVELIQDSINSGLTFYFKVNGIPIFAKGSNEIPIDILPEKGQDKATILRVLSDAERAYMNMLRVWGGGVYESDYFYDLADELGILIWQDFMFACSLYPVNEDYLNTVLDEVRHQTKRLRGHASVALFSGNNENEGALRDNWYGTASNFDRFKQDYVKLYIDTIQKEFERVTHNTGIFISSSPTNGKETEEEGYVAQQPGSSLYGDVHYYNYFMDPFESLIYPIPRFASEYGYQSLPSIASLLTATNSTSNLNITSAFMDHRQHHPAGNVELKALIDYELKLPEETSPNYYKAFIYYSQIVHAVSIKVETEHYRRYRGIMNDVGQGDTMGALYWQLNDVWIAPTWSSVDYTGRWKILHYYATQFFAPVIITGHMDAARNLQIYIVSDLLSPLENVTASIQVYKWDSFEPISEEKIVTDLDSGKSHLISSFMVDDYLIEKGCGTQFEAKRNCFIHLSLYREGVQVGPYNFVLPEKLKNSQLQQSTVTINSTRKVGDDGIFEIEISTDKIALFVWLESGKISGRFSENGFIEVNSNRNIFFFTDEDVTADQLQQELTVTHLLDQQYFVYFKYSV